MNLDYHNEEHSISVFRDLFEEEFFKQLANILNNHVVIRLGRISAVGATPHWGCNFAPHMPPKNGLDISDQIDGIVSEAWNILKGTLFPDKVLTRVFMNGYTYGTEGYPHTDSARLDDETLIVHLNDSWNIAWGGETTIYKGGKIIFGQLPVRNSGLLYKGHYMHCGRGVSRTCMVMRSNVVFRVATKNLDPVRDTLQVHLKEMGIFEQPYGPQSMGDRILRTYDLLNRYTSDQELALASIHFLCRDEREKLRDFVGERAFTIAGSYNGALMNNSDLWIPVDPNLCRLKAVDVLGFGSGQDQVRYGEIISDLKGGKE